LQSGGGIEMKSMELRQIVFNTCEEIPAIPHRYDLIARSLEELGYSL
jgi:hypothetical protein